jgi:hypothetical protein
MTFRALELANHLPRQLSKQTDVIAKSRRFIADLNTTRFGNLGAPTGRAAGVAALGAHFERLT